MKKIIIVNNNMKVGGVQKSLYNLLWSIDGKYEITLLLFRAIGEYMHCLPTGVNVLEVEGLFRYLGVSQGECRGVDKLKRGILVVLCRILGRSRVMKLLLASQKMLLDEYDCAIAFLHNGKVKNFYGGVQDFVLHRVKAKKKVAFLHCDYQNCGANHQSNNQLIGQFDLVAACSDGCRQVFQSVLPELTSKCITVNNCHRFDEIRAMAIDHAVEYDRNYCNVVMVSRLAHEKGVERALVAMACAVEKNIPVALHIIGGGPMETYLRERVAELKITDVVFFYGEKGNPYRYMKNADLFLMTSFHEAAPMVIEEAACLGVPVLTVETTSSDEMVVQQGRGWVCENKQGALNEMFVQVLSDADWLHSVRERVHSSVMDNTLALERFAKMIEG